MATIPAHCGDPALVPPTTTPAIRDKPSPVRGSTTPAPRTPDTQHLSSRRGGTLFFNQQVASVSAVRG